MKTFSESFYHINSTRPSIPTANRSSGLAPIYPSSLGIPRGAAEQATGVYLDVHEDCERRPQQSGKPKCEGYIYTNWQSLPGSSFSLALAEAAIQSDRTILVIAKDVASCVRFAEEIKFFLDAKFKAGQEMPVLVFPDWETLPYDHFSPHQDIISERILTLYKLPNLKQGIVLVASNSLLQRLPPVSYIAANSFVLKCSDVLDALALKARLVKHGYHSVSKVMEHGEFAVRGSIIDIFPMGSQAPFRIDLFDQQVETIRYFDPDTQLSTGKVEEINLLPAKEFPLTEDGVAHFRQAWRSVFSGATHDNPIYQSVTRGESVGGIEYYSPLFFAEMDNLFSYLPRNTLLVSFVGLEETCHSFLGEVKERYEQLRYDRYRPLLAPAQLFLPVDEMFAAMKNFPRLKVFTAEAVPEKEEHFTTSFHITTLPDISIESRAEKSLGKLQNFLRTTSCRTLFCAESLGRRESLCELLKAILVQPKVYDSWQDFLRDSNASAARVGIIVAELEEGFILGDDAIAIITESELFGHKLIMQRRLRKKEDRPDVSRMVNDLIELHIGAPVVHLEYGVGLYLGLQSLRAGDIDAEYLVLGYANDTKLYVPVSSLHLVNRYTGVGSENVALNELGGKQWEKAKRKAIEKIKDVAAELLEIYARRAAQKGSAFKAPELEYQKFVAGFPFEETPDQQKAIADVIHDMQQEKNMDRLICGDVGFGKTEVAMRAAFIAVFNHKQVALLAPTTILAQQHYNNFCDRFAELPVNIELLSRFRTTKEQKIALDKLQEGKVDIVIGTHKLLQPSVKFKDLGLLIVDEEHRFGVRQKERVKEIRPNVDILTLTATPIPRTLNMAFAGVRDFSIIATPPLKRLSIKTFFHEREDHLIREAILREILRGGQVYFLHNNVSTIEKTAQELQKLVPNIRVATAHGQMMERQLERVMGEFYHQRYNVLVCTTIIESGIDVPTANTIIIDHADRFGLAQLHQLRGRVGRSHHQAYAYLLVPAKKLLTQDAKRRLEVITSMEDLGAGFNLAGHDLEIRGAGELLGEEQSGQIESIGFGLYMEYLEEAVKILQKNQENIDVDLYTTLENAKTITEIDLKIPALIPEIYIHDISMRLVLYKRIASAREEGCLIALQEEMIDRFGLLPDAVKNLFAVTRLRMQAEKLGIRKIAAHAKGGMVEFVARPSVELKRIIDLIQKNPGKYKLRGSNKLEFMTPMEKPSERIAFVANMLESFA